MNVFFEINCEPEQGTLIYDLSENWNVKCQTNKNKIPQRWALSIRASVVYMVVFAQFYFCYL